MSEIDWEKSNPENVALVLSEYEKQLAAGHELYGVLDDKARWLLTFTVPLGAVLAGYVFVGGLGTPCSIGAAIVLALLLFASSILAALALRTRSYRVGAALPRDGISDWKTLIEGGAKESKTFSRVRIETIAKALSVNDASNDSKSAYIRCSIWFGCLAAPIAALIFVACHILLFFTIPNFVCPFVP